MCFVIGSFRMAGWLSDDTLDTLLAQKVRQDGTSEEFGKNIKFCQPLKEHGKYAEPILNCFRFQQRNLFSDRKQDRSSVSDRL